MTTEISDWYTSARLGEECTPDTRCECATSDGDCEHCGTIDGRFMEAVNEYASTCDGECMELTHHELLRMDPDTQLAYCDVCFLTLPLEIKARIEKFERESLEGRSRFK